MPRSGDPFDVSNPAWLPAERQIALFKAGLLSPVDILNAQIARIERHGAALNAITYEHFDEALGAAREADVIALARRVR
jgi:amidase